MSKHNMWAVFGTDKGKERDGVVFEYPGNIRVTLARAGGSNEAFAKAYEKHMRPHRKMATAGLLTEDQSRSIMINTYLDSIICKFETNLADEGQPDDWQESIIWQDGELVEATRSNLFKLLEMLPDLFSQIISDAGDLASYRATDIEDAVKNS